MLSQWLNIRNFIAATFSFYKVLFRVYIFQTRQRLSSRTSPGWRDLPYILFFLYAVDSSHPFGMTVNFLRSKFPIYAIERYKSTKTTR